MASNSLVFYREEFKVNRRPTDLIKLIPVSIPKTVIFRTLSPHFTPILATDELYLSKSRLFVLPLSGEYSHIHDAGLIGGALRLPEYDAVVINQLASLHLLDQPKHREALVFLDNRKYGRLRAQYRRLGRVCLMAPPVPSITKPIPTSCVHCYQGVGFDQHEARLCHRKLIQACTNDLCDGFHPYDEIDARVVHETDPCSECFEPAQHMISECPHPRRLDISDPWSAYQHKDSASDMSISMEELDW